MTDLNRLSRDVVLDHLTYPINPAEYLPRAVCEQLSPEDTHTLSVLCVGLLAWVRSQVAEQLDTPENGDTP
jgi:hypothetical protein